MFATIGYESIRGSALFFNRGGIEYLDNDSTSSSPSTKSSFSWSIEDEKLVIDGDTYTLENKTGDTYQMRVGGQSVFFHKAKALKLTDLDTKVLDYIYASGSVGDCMRTLKITGASAVIKEKDCDVVGNAPERTMSVKDLADEAVNPVNNAIEFTEGESKVIMILTTGTLAEGEVTHVYLDASGKLKNVELEEIKTVTDEAF